MNLFFLLYIVTEEISQHKKRKGQRIYGDEISTSIKDRESKSMGIIELIFLAVGLAMDAFAVSVCKGLAMKKIEFRSCIVCGLWFGGFQALMPLAGYILGSRFEKYVEVLAPWIAFGLLTLIGANMIREAFLKEENEISASLDVKTMFLMAVATSMDALAVGITFSCIPVRVVPLNAFYNTLTAAAVIGIITFVLACFGVKVGNVFGTRYRSKAEFSGGVILLLTGLKILLEHFFA